MVFRRSWRRARRRSTGSDADADDLPVAAGAVRRSSRCGHVALVAGRQQQVLAALARVGAGQAHVGNPALVDVHRAARSAARAGARRPAGRCRDRAAAARRACRSSAVKTSCSGAQSRMPNTLFGTSADLLVALDDRRAGDGRVEELVGLDGADSDRHRHTPSGRSQVSGSRP